MNGLLEDLIYRKKIFEIIYELKKINYGFINYNIK